MKNRRWLVLVITVILLAAAILALKKFQLPLKIKAGGITSLTGLSNQAKELEAAGNLYGAKTAYQGMVNEFPNSGEVAAWQKKIGDLNIRLLFSPQATPNSVMYEVKAGDTVVKIAREFKTTPELIMKSNNISAGKIFPGKKIKVWTAPFSILVDKSQNILIVKSNEEIIKTYIVATGANNSTPVGTFKVANKLPNPTWYKAGAVVAAGSPENILGSRWLGLDLSGYGIHGTTDPQSLGKQVTQGCVRMSNPEVEELYTYIPVGTEVTIVD
jgi:lipoprotein-anchoring transpeptidase ErfK/SrfK